ncbi:MAG: DEAD/DEAH box helicase [Pseudomonadota bacterium]|nr:DEAD/DEAH box helicase [Pseudomonadota bacterium]
MNALTYDFQDKAIDALFEYYKENTGHTLIVAPTGSGKTHILSKIIKRLYEQNKNVCITVITHTKEIIEQDYDTLCQYIDPGLVGIYSAGIGRKEVRQFTIAGVQSVYKHSYLFADCDFMIVDEAHLIPPSGMGMYRTLFEDLKCPIVGLTATPFRRGHGYLTDNHIFDKIIYDIPVDKLIEQNYLCNLVPKHPGLEIDVKGLHVVGGDYNKQELALRVDNTHMTSQIIPKLTPYKSLRKKWLIFAIDIKHAEHIADELRHNGVLADTVHSQMDEAREEVIRNFKDSNIQALVSVETLTTGFNVPDIDMIVLLRPTRSPVLHVQMIGRGLRTSPGKQNCLVLDFSGNVARLGPINDVHIPQKNIKKGSAKNHVFVKVCPDCATLVHIHLMQCPECSYRFPEKTKLNTRSSEADLVKTKSDRHKSVEIVHVDYIGYYKYYVTNRKAYTLKVMYRSGIHTFNEYISVAGNNYSRKKAVDWWSYRTSMSMPDNVDDAITMAPFLRKPEYIGVVKIGRYYNIVKYIWKERK